MQQKNLNLKAFFKILDFLRKETEIRVDSLNSLFDMNNQQKEKSKRGLEILGELMSTAIGVPSARDHRAVLEKLRLLRLDMDEIKSMLDTGINANNALLRSLHMHESRLADYGHAMENLSGRIQSQQSYAEPLLEVLNFKSSLDLKLSKTDKILSTAENILQEGRYDRVSEMAIDVTSLRKIVENIILKHRILRPVFEGKNCNKYFDLDTAHSWAEKNYL